MGIGIGESNTAALNWFSHGNFDQSAFLQFLFDKFADDTGCTDANLGKFDQQVHGADLQNLIGFDLVPVEIVIDILAGDILLVKQHQGSRKKQIGICMLPDGEVIQIRLGSDKGILDLLQGQKGKCTMMLRSTDQANIDLTAFQ